MDSINFAVTDSAVCPDLMDGMNNNNNTNNTFDATKLLYSEQSYTFRPFKVIIWLA
jgi:hypothetical protein